MIAYSLLLSSLMIDWVAAQVQNTNDTKSIVNVKNRTISVVDTRTNETISVRNFGTSDENMTAAGNMTAKVNLTEKFSELSK